MPPPYGGGEVDPLKFFDSVSRPAPAKPPAPPVAVLGGLARRALSAAGGDPRSRPRRRRRRRKSDHGIPVDYNPLADESAIRPDPGGSAAAAERAAAPAKDERAAAAAAFVTAAPGDSDAHPAGTGQRAAPGQRAAGQRRPADRPAAAGRRLRRPRPRLRSSALTPPLGESAARDLADVLAGAGLPGAPVTPELARNLGQILRVVVAGLIDVLQSRQRIKEEFRMHQTMFRPADNNPLKFSANVEDALHNLLVKRNAAYLGPVEAFADAFDDLRDHQLAMLAGMRVAFEAMLADFDPDRLQEEFDRQIAKVSLPLMPAKMRYWDLYREKRREIKKDPEAAFARLFGEEFARAYEEQFRELQAQRRTRAAEQLEGAAPADT